MIVLGIGSNLGDRLSHLRLALKLIRNIPAVIVQKISPVYISDALLPEQAPASWNVPYLNAAIGIETTLTPYDLLSELQKIEKIIGRTPEKKWGPRVIDIDILAWNDLTQHDEKLHLPHKHLHERPFALWPLSDIAPRWIHPRLQKTATELTMAWGSRFSGEAQQILHRIDTPRLMGIVNVTPNSFSGDGKNTDIISYIHHLAQSGAEIIDIGAEATNPNASPISAETEWQRLEPVLQTLRHEKFFLSPKISIDTRHAETAKKALDLGIDWINDQTGLKDPEMREIVVHSSCDAVFMHHLTIPEDRRYSLPIEKDPVKLVLQWAKEQLDMIEKNGISRERLIFDMGIGFGKTAAQSLELLQHADVFQQLGTRLLIGHSRKSFFSLFTDKPAAERDVETLAVSLSLLKQPVDYLRVHQVEMHARAFKLFCAL